METITRTVVDLLRLQECFTHKGREVTVTGGGLKNDDLCIGDRRYTKT